jgi:hypothetical protein
LPHGGPGHPGQRFGLADAIAELACDLASLLGFGAGTVEFADHEVEGRLRPVNFDDRVPVRQPVQVPRRLERLVVEGEGLTNRESLGGFSGGHQEVLERLWPLLGHRGGRRVPGDVFHGLEAEDGDQARRRQRIDVTAEAPGLLDGYFHGPAEL